MRDRYLTGETTPEGFESQIGDMLGPGWRIEMTPTGYVERWEIHVHGGAPGHSLHIHLP